VCVRLKRHFVLHKTEEKEKKKNHQTVQINKAVSKSDFMRELKMMSDNDKGLQAQAFSFNLEAPMASSVVDQGELADPSPAGLGA
jgi:hypothetical protein